MAYPISDVTRRIIYSGSAGVGPYSFSFEILEQTDVAVYKNSTLLTLTTDYSVTINADGTGSVTLVSAATASDQITLFGDRAIERSTDFVTGGDLFANSLNEELDSQTIFAQQIDEKADRAIKAPITDPTTVDMTLPSKADRAEKLLSFDTDGNPDVTDTADIIAGLSGAIVGANYVVTNATGNGSSVAFTVSSAPGAKSNIQIYIDGVYQNKNTFSISGTTVTFTEAPPSGAAIEFVVGYAIGVGGGAAEITYTPAGTGAQTTTVQAKLRETVSVKDFGAVGDGVTNDWEACQKACDYVQSLGGGTVIFPAGKTFRIAGNTIIIWGNNVNLIGYGATLYKDNAGGSAGYYGDALTVFGKVNGILYYSPQVAGGSYTSPATYNGSTVPSVNINIEGFTVTFGTHLTDSINGISGLNFEHVTVKNCVVENAPQTSFAWVASENTSCVHVTMDNCFSDGAGMQAFRFNSYNTNPGDAGEMFAKVINCRSENTQLTVVSPWPEQYGLPSSAFVRASGNDIQFQVSFDNCQFDSTTHLLDGYRTTSFRNCRLGFVFALNASPACNLMFDNCRFRAFDAATGFGVIDSQLYLRNQYNGSAKFVIEGCSFETSSATQYNIVDYGFDLAVRNSTGEINIYSVPEGSGYENTTIVENCILKNSGSSAVTVAGKTNNFSSCVFQSPLVVIGTNKKTVTVEDSQFVVNASFVTFCIQVASDASVRAVNNIVDYTDNAYATVRIADITYVAEKSNTYLYAGGTALSYDEVYATSTPASGYWQTTSRIINAQPTAGQPKAWTCTVAGAPGTWVSEGNL